MEKRRKENAREPYLLDPLARLVKLALLPYPLSLPSLSLLHLPPTPGGSPTVLLLPRADAADGPRHAVGPGRRPSSTTATSGARRAGPETMRFDGCDHGLHIFCLRPILPRVPAGDWFCPSCTTTATSGTSAAATAVQTKMPKQFPLIPEFLVLVHVFFGGVPGREARGRQQKQRPLASGRARAEARSTLPSPQSTMSVR